MAWFKPGKPMVYLSRIYTRTGDDGLTSLGTGERLPKDALRISATGEVDELNSLLGVLLATAGVPETDLLRAIQNDLFDVGGDLCIPVAAGEGRALRITAAHIEKLEAAIDRLNEALEPLRSFILPGGSPAAAYCHLARTVCRRAERVLVTLFREEKDQLNPHCLIYLNRLSDLLFVLARLANDNGKSDVLWVPGQGGKTS